MLGLAWLTLRQVQEALKNGRLEEAHRLLLQPGTLGHKGSWELLQQVARGFVERGQRHVQHADTVAAWQDLLQAEQMGLVDSGSARLRQDLVGRGLADARALLEAGQPGRAAETLAQLRDRSVQQAELQVLQEVAAAWIEARELADRGEFAAALQAVERALQHLPEPPAALTRCRSDLEQRSKTFAHLLVQLHEAADRGRWREVLQKAEQVLAVAPQHVQARRTRALAWRSIEPATMAAPRRLEERRSPNPKEPSLGLSGTGVDCGGTSQRFLLWIDGVGGYLVCLGNRITLGQATPEAAVDLPLFADVSRLHAVLTRDAEGYLLEALRPVQVNGSVVEKVLLRPGDRITLGRACQMQFHQPVPVSATGQLELVSSHRLPLAIDRVFLMADTLVLGPGPQAHVVMPELKQPVMLFRQKEGLGVRHAGNLIVDGIPCRERGTLAPCSKVTGDDFGFAVEPVAMRLGRI